MFRANATQKLPRNTLQPLWRYIRAEKLKDLLLSKSLFFCGLSSFSDGLEGKLTERTQKRFLKWHYTTHGTNYDAIGALSQYLEHQKEFLVNCWHMNSAESYLMWKAYAEHGFAIQTTFERTSAAFESFGGLITGGVVEYVDFSRHETTFGNVFNHVITKDLPYSDEREFRFLLWRCDQANSSLGIAQDGHKVNIDVKMLVERIYVNPFHASISSELLDLINEAGLGGRIAESSVVYNGPIPT